MSPKIKPPVEILKSSKALNFSTFPWLNQSRHRTFDDGLRLSRSSLTSIYNLNSLRRRGGSGLSHELSVGMLGFSYTLQKSYNSSDMDGTKEFFPSGISEQPNHGVATPQ